MRYKIKSIIYTFTLCVTFWIPGVFGQDQQVNIRFEGVQGELLTNVEKHVRLYQRLTSQTEVSVGEQLRLKRTVSDEIKQALNPFGYYLAEAALSQESSLESLVYRIQLNEPVRINSIILDISDADQQQTIFESWRQNFALRENDVLDQVRYENEKKTLIADALRLGYFDAAFTTQSILIKESRTSADIRLRFSSGNRYRVGTIDTVWEIDNGGVEQRPKDPINSNILEGLISIKTGDYYDADQIATTRKNLLASPYFTNVIILAAHDDAIDSVVPISLNLVAKKKHSYSIEAGVGTDTGIRGGIGFENRRVNTLGHTMGFRAGGAEISRSAILNYRIPFRRSVSDSINVFATLEEEIGQVRRFTATKIGSELLLNWSNSILRFGLTASTETFKRLQADDLQSNQTTKLLLPSIKFENSTTTDIFFPKHGRSFSALLRATSSLLGSDLDLAQAVLEGKHLFPMGTGRLKLRVKLAGSLIGNFQEIPESLGFLAGGDDSIRGYKYESVGVTTRGVVSVGKHLVVGSIEYEYPVKNNMSAAAFFDAGDVFSDRPVFKKGAGVGLRWNLLFGSMRFDVASALDKEGNPLRVHFSVGTDL